MSHRGRCSCEVQNKLPIRQNSTIQGRAHGHLPNSSLDLVSVAMLAAITLLSHFFYSIVYVLRSKDLQLSETWTEGERIRIWWLKIGTAIAVVLCWTGSLIAAGDSPAGGEWCNQLVLCSTEIPAMAILTIWRSVCWLWLSLDYQCCRRHFGLKLLRHNWSDGEAPSNIELQS